MNRKKTLEICRDLIVPYPEVKIADNTHVLSKEYSALTHKIDQLRDANLPSSVFRTIIEEITELEIIEATRNFKLEEYEIETPICKMVAHRIAGKKMVLAPIMRAGLGMEPAVKRVFPQSRTGHIGLYRNEVTFEPVEYFYKMPKNAEEREIFILDPMLATGGSADSAISKLKSMGCDGRNINFICIIAAPQGVDLLQKKHPEVSLYIGTVDLGLNENNYIVPGLGDAGDRIFGTK